MASWSGECRAAIARRELDRQRDMDAPFGPGYRDLPPRLADVSAAANTAEADTPADGRAHTVITHAYVHWHDPDTVTIHPFKDTPLGDAA